MTRREFLKLGGTFTATMAVPWFRTAQAVEEETDGFPALVKAIILALLGRK